ncbi:MAG: cobalamin-binding protein [Alphaproteobacteria bacterium]|nr:cobalamin-binding protein [Alphaproteobacteria bacterium]
MRIVSLLPSATEIAVALGFADQLVGRSHECDFPASVKGLPALTASKLRKGLSSLEIDREVQAIVSQGLSVYEVDAERLRALKPDIILTQTQCAVCAVTPDDLQGALNEWSGSKPQLLSLAPDALADVWDDIRRVSAALSATPTGERVISELEARLHALRTKIALGAKPTVAAIEWTEPLMAAGNWIPELIEAAGGRPLFAAAGQHSPWLAWETLAEADPDVVVLMPCGYRIADTLAELKSLNDHPAWQSLTAVREDRVFVTDGHHFFNRPGPRLVESAEILAEILGTAKVGHEGSGWIRLSGA